MTRLPRRSACRPTPGSLLRRREKSPPLRGRAAAFARNDKGSLAEYGLIKSVVCQPSRRPSVPKDSGQAKTAIAVQKETDQWLPGNNRGRFSAVFRWPWVWAIALSCIAAIILAAFAIAGQPL